MPQAIVTAFKSDRANYSHLTLARPEGFIYVPGQYVTLAQDATEKPKFLAIASHASESNLYFLSRNSPPAVGAEMILSEPMGKGFTCDFKNPQAFLFLTHGTGISAIRPALIERRQSGFTHDTLLYGIRDAASEGHGGDS
jgi:ferredoxin-NADP reductase